MAIGSQRLIGFAFASADLLIEISPDGIIVFAMGASEALSGSTETELVGRDWRDFVEPGDHCLMSMLIDGLEPGRRVGPAVLRLSAPQRAATLMAFRMPQNKGAISCALTRATYVDVPTGLLDRGQFEALTCELVQSAEATGRELELSLIELDGLEAARQQASSPEAREALELQIAGMLRAQAYGDAVTGLDADRFALVRVAGESQDALLQRLTRLLSNASQHPITPTADVVPLGGVEDPRQMLRALRYVLDQFSTADPSWKSPSSLLEALDMAMRRTLDDAGALGATIREREFRLAYQPVVGLKDNSVHHFEVLVRFGEEESPFPRIRMAEEMQLIEPLDLAILEKAIDVLASDETLQLAVNVSGRTITSPQYIDQAVRLIKSRRGVGPRLLFELTESAAVEDLALTDRHLQALRDQGCEICLDDFGAGAASLAYLQQLRLDILKIDGRYIRDLQCGGREATFVKHLVQMCRELEIRTLAEMVETTAAEKAVRDAGVDYAQGWLYGLATDTPKALTPMNRWIPLKAG